MSDENVKRGYESFRGGLRRGQKYSMPPAWEKLPPWIMDALRVVYFQGYLMGVAEAKQEKSTPASKQQVDKAPGSE